MSAWVLFYTLLKHKLTRLYDRGLKGASLRCLAARSYCDLSSCQPVLRGRTLCMSPGTWDGHNTHRHGHWTQHWGLQLLPPNTFFTVRKFGSPLSRHVVLMYCSGPCAAATRMRTSARANKRTSGKRTGNGRDFWTNETLALNGSSEFLVSILIFTLV